MSTRILPLLAALTCCATLQAGAQKPAPPSSATAARTIAPPPLVNAPIQRDPRLDEVRAAFAAADAGNAAVSRLD